MSKITGVTRLCARKLQSFSKFTRLLKTAAGLLAIALFQVIAAPGVAIAGNASFIGTFALDDYVETFEFTLSQAQTVTIRSLGYLGGTNASGQVVSGGGFDPVVTLFGADGTWITTSDDGSSGLDSEIIAALAAGTYTAAITQFNNFAVANGNTSGNLSEGFTGANTTGFNARSGAWALDILNVDSARRMTIAEARVVPPDADRFLTFFSAVSPAHEESETTARAYYAEIDPSNERMDLNAWKLKNGFDGSETPAIYVNEADLGFGRRMYIKKIGGDVASYVQNYGDSVPLDQDPVDGPADLKINNAHFGNGLIATVAMEYSAHPNDPSNTRYTKFYVFGPDGSRLTKVDLDGRGAKFVPGTCNVCHGGNPRPLLNDSYADFGDTGAGFLPWDLDVLGFSDTVLSGQYSRANQEAILKTFNAVVLDTNPTPAAREVIEGWYGGPGFPNPTFDGHFVPSGWQAQPEYYLDVVGPNCRACHIMRSPAVDLNKYSEYQALDSRIKDLVFERGVMPLAKRTYERFWVDRTPQNSRVSTDSSDVEALNTSYDASISGDGRFVAFSSYANNLVPVDNNPNNWDVFIKDTQTGTTTLISTDSTNSPGGQGIGQNLFPAISGDGRFVAFSSDATNLATDTNGFTDIFLKDTQSGATTLVSTNTGATTQANNDSHYPAISGDGQFVAFWSSADNLVTGDTNGAADVFVKNTQSGVTTLVSNGATAPSNSDSFQPAVSADGRYVVFWSFATNLANDVDTFSAIADAFLKDMQTDTTVRVNTHTNGNQANNTGSALSISADGRYVVFESLASNLVDNDTNAVSDIFIRDTQANVTTRVSTDINGNEANGNSNAPVISADGRFVAFESAADNLVLNDANAVTDIFIKDMQTGAITRATSDTILGMVNGDSNKPTISSSGRYLAFHSSASNLAADNNNALDVFVHDSSGSTAPQSGVFGGYLGSPGVAETLTFAGVAEQVYAGFPYRLDASDSLFANPTGSLPAFEWSLVSQPPGSASTLSNPNTRTPEFTPDMEGLYIFELLARNGYGGTTDQINVTASLNTLPVTGTDYAQVESVITTNCTSCHNLASPYTDGNGNIASAFDAPDFGDPSEAIYRNLIQRVNVLQPTSSLLLLKGLNQVSHGGGQQFTTSDYEYYTLRNWITDGASREGLMAAPLNDNFADARIISGMSGTDTGTNINAGHEPDEPRNALNNLGDSVWWTWTAPVSGNVEISTVGSNFFTVLTIFTGSSLDTLSIVTGDVSSGASNTSLVNFPVTANTTYSIMVNSQALWPPGVIQLNWSYPPPANDTFATASVISGASGQFNGSNAGASKETSEPDHAGNTGGASTWFTWTPSISGIYTLDTVGSSFDTLLAVYSGSDVTALTEIDANDNSAGQLTSSVTITVVAGQQYYIAIDGASGAQGDFVLNLDQFLADGDLNIDGVVDTVDILIGQRILAGTITPTQLQMSHGDVAPLSGGIPAPDGEFNAGDLVVIMRKAQGEINF